MRKRPWLTELWIIYQALMTRYGGSRNAAIRSCCTVHQLRGNADADAPNAGKNTKHHAEPARQHPIVYKRILV